MFLRSRSIKRRHARRGTLDTRPVIFESASSSALEFLAHNLFIEFGDNLFIIYLFILCCNKVLIRTYDNVNTKMYIDVRLICFNLYRCIRLHHLADV